MGRALPITKLNRRKAFQVVKCQVLSRAPAWESPGRILVAKTRRLLRIPHQECYRPIRDVDADGVFLDIGANRGQSIESIRLFKPAADIVSFEIIPKLAEWLTRVYPDVTVHPFGLGSQEREVPIFYPRFGEYCQYAVSSVNPAQVDRFLSRCAPYARGVRDQQICRVRTLDSFELAPAFIKIDVEGMEREVVLGGLETIKAHRPTLLIESGKGVANLLVPLGYEAETVKGGTWFRPT